MDPIRSCVICKKRSLKNELYRIISKDGKLLIDRNQTINTRGIYFCKNKKCIENTIKCLNRNKLNLKINYTKEELLNILKSLESELGE